MWFLLLVALGYQSLLIRALNNAHPNWLRHEYFLFSKYYALIMTTSINTLIISYHMHISLLIHSFIHSFTFQSQYQISQELHNHQYYSISIKSRSCIKKNQTIKKEYKTFFLAWARILSLDRKFSRLSEDALQIRSTSSTIFNWMRFSSLDQKCTREQVPIFTCAIIPSLSKNESESRFPFLLEREYSCLSKICKKNQLYF